MSLGGIAIAIGAMVDAAVVMIENAHKHLERWRHEHPGEELRGEAHWRVIGDAAVEVGPGAVLLAADHHAVVHPGVHARSAGGAAVLAARLHQDLRDGRRGRARGDAGPGADGLPDPRPHPRRAAQSAEPRADRGLPAAARRACCAFRSATLVVALRRARRQRLAARATRRRVHAAARRRRPAVHADRRCRGSRPARRPSCCSRPTG